MADQVTLTIDHHVICVPKGMLIVDAAKEAGINIPVFCYHPKMEPVGMCRMCLVEIGRPQIDRESGKPLLKADGNPDVRFGPKLETACTTPVTEGMVVNTTTDQVREARNAMLEFILTSHPLDCPVCDKGGECPLQNLTMAHGPDVSRFVFSEKMHSAKHVPLGDLIFLDRERCIQCGRCVRFEHEIVNDPVLAFHQRGRKLEIITSSEPGFDSIFSGNTTDICPVGALTTADFRFGARPWEMNLSASICEHCPVGCNTVNNVRREAKSGGRSVIKRIMPRQNEAVNEIWMCDKGRFGYHYAEQPERLTTPMLRKNGKLQPATWDEALSLAAFKLSAAGEDLITLVSGRLANEDLYNLRQFNKGWQGILYNTLGGGELANQVGVGKGTNLKEVGSGTVIVIAASDLHEEAPLYWLRIKQAAERGAKVIVWHPRITRTDEFASLSLRYSYGREADEAQILLKADGKSGRADVIQARQMLDSAENVLVFLGGEGMGIAQSNVVAHYFSEFLLRSHHAGRPNNGLVMVWPHANTQGAWDMGFKPVENLNLALQEAKAVWVAGADPAGDDPQLAETLKNSGFLAVQELFLTETARMADVVFPVQAKAEREGTYTNAERRVQRFYPAVDAPQGTQPDYWIAAQLAERMGLHLESAAALVMKQIAAHVNRYEEINYAALAYSEPQHPIIGRSDLYYGGTMYENKQGLGVQLDSLADRKEALNIVLPNHPLEISVPGGGMVAYPLTRLYDRGSMLIENQTLHNRLAQKSVWLSADTARRIGLVDKGLANLQIGNANTTIRVQIEPELPDDCAVIPRSMGIPLFGPVAVTIQALQTETRS
jgi:NADH-quinone oxidoreductase subunit G